MSFSRYERYKESGVEWLGEVPEHWQVKRLKFSARLVTDRATDRTNPVALENIEPWTGRLLPSDTEFDGEGIAFRVGDVLFGKLRPYLAKAHLAKIDGEAIGDFHVMRPAAGVLGEFFLRQILNRDVINIIDGSTFGAKMPRASWDFLSTVPVVTPPVEEQAKIAQFISRETAKIDALVKEQRRLIELMKEKRQAVISQAVMSDSDLRMTGTAKNREDGVLIGSWPSIALKRLCSLLKDGTHLPPDRVDFGVPLLSVRNLVDGRFILLDDDSMISEESYIELSRSYVPEPGDVLLAIVGATLGKTAIVPQQIGPFHIQRSVAIFRPRPSLLMSEFLYYCFQSTSFQNLLWEYAGFSAQPGIYLGTLQNFRIAVPPIAHQLAVVEYLRARTHSFDTLVRSGESAISLLEERRAALISAAVTGKIDVRGYSPEEAA